MVGEHRSSADTDCSRANHIHGRSAAAEGEIKRSRRGVGPAGGGVPGQQGSALGTDRLRAVTVTAASACALTCAQLCVLLSLPKRVRANWTSQEKF